MSLHPILWSLWLSVASADATWSVRDSNGAPTTRMVDPSALFSVADAGWAGGRSVVTDLDAIAEVAENTARWIRSGSSCAVLAGGGAPSTLGLSAEQTLATLDVIARIAREDIGKPESRLSDPAFLEAHFDLWWWSPDRVGARTRGYNLPSNHIRITRYLVSRIDGRDAPEGAYRHALYADPGPDARRQFTRREVIRGAWSDGGARPLVWLTERGVYEANMQGTVAVRLPDGRERMFNVHENNGHAYRYGVSAGSQDRYWYFREVDGAYGFGAPEDCPAPGKVKLAAKAAVAGDIHNVGLGRLVMMEGKDGLHLAVLADTGGAFGPNLFQLDWFGGSYDSHGALYTATANVPETTRVGLLVVKPPG
jgi:hypothetical protein